MEKRIEKGRFLAEFSTLGIGGEVSFVFQAKTIEEVIFAFKWAKERSLPVIVLGKGSNSLFDDHKYQALALICQIDECEFKDDLVFVGAGYNFSLLGSQTARKGFSGLEFASGIPASVGGAIFMNAGANGQETKDCLVKVSFLKDDLEIVEFKKEEIEFGYRQSSFQKMKGCILNALFQLARNEQARPNQLKLLDQRLKTQPYKDKSAGCAFKNPKEGISAGMLIDRCGLKGLSIGGAKVSEKHANFIVNANSATAQDVRSLMQEIQRKVEIETGIHLEPEIRLFES